MKLENVFSLLSEEPHVRNRSQIERNRIRRELRNYCAEIFHNRQSINNQEIERRAQTFLNQVLLPEQEWLVVSPIEGLNLEGRGGGNAIQRTQGITISNYSINWFDISHITQFITGELRANDQRTLQESLLGRVCVFVSPVMAIDSKQAIERGRKKIDQILHLMRGFFGTHTFYNLPTPNVCVAINRTPPIEWSISDAIHDEGCHINAEQVGSLSNYMSSFSDFLDSSVPQPIRDDLMRAVTWLGNAVQDKELEDKLVKHFFALETLLIHEERGVKKEKLKSRLGSLYFRINGNLPYTDFLDDIDDLYQKRSNIVHGGNLEEEPVTQADIAFLEPLTREVILAISNITINNQGAITTIRELVDWIEPDKKLGKLFKISI